MDSGSCTGVDGKIIAPAKTYLRLRGVFREADSPELLCLVVVFHKFDAVGRYTLHGCDHGHDSGRDFGATLILQGHDRSNWQVAAQLHSGSVSIQARGLRRHGERDLQPILSRHANSGIQGHPTAAPLRDL